MLDHPLPPARSPSRRQWFQFRLRTVLVVFAVMSVCLAIVSSRANRQRQAVEKIKAAGGIAVYDFECDEGFKRRTDDPQPPGPEWLRRLIGIDYFATVTYVSFHEANDTSLALLTELPKLRALELTDDRNISDAGMWCLEDLPLLEALYIDGCAKVTDASVEHLRVLKNLRVLIALQTSISLDGMRKLQLALPDLKTDYPD